MPAYARAAEFTAGGSILSARSSSAALAAVFAGLLASVAPVAHALFVDDFTQAGTPGFPVDAAHGASLRGSGTISQTVAGALGGTRRIDYATLHGLPGTPGLYSGTEIAWTDLVFYFAGLTGSIDLAHVDAISLRYRTDYAQDAALDYLSVVPVPAPATLALLAAGLGVLISFGLRPAARRRAPSCGQESPSSRGGNAARVQRLQ